MSGPLYRVLAQLVAARATCAATGNAEWEKRHTDTLLKLVLDRMPRGAGIDQGTQLRLDDCTPNKLVFGTAFHHMDEHGGYDGWTEHIVSVRPSLTSTIEVDIRGSNRNQIRDYLHDVFLDALTAEVEV